MKRRLLFPALLSALVAVVNAAPGDLDLTLNSLGKIRGGLGGAQDDGAAMAVQNDGKIVVAGTGSYTQFAFGLGSNVQKAIVARYHADGSLDLTFGAGTGAVVVPGFNNSVGAAVAVRSDGKIIVAGYETIPNAPAQLAVYRFHPDGSPDTSFDSDGVAKPSFGASSYAQGVLLQSDKIIVFGQIGSSFAVARFDSNGALDSTFGGGDGIANIAFNGVARGGTFQSSGAILATGGFCQSGGLFDCNVAVVRLSGSDGAPDGTFHNDGIVTTDIAGSSTELGNVVRIQAGNNTFNNPDEIVVAGVSAGNLTLLRYDLAGQPDPSLGGDGILLAPILAGNATATGLGFQTTAGTASRIVVTGSAGTSPNRDFLVVRLRLDGMFDTAFDGDGIVTTPIGATDDVGNAMVLSSGKIIVAGRTVVGTGSFASADFALARYNLTDGALDIAFDTDGKMTDDVFDLPSSARAIAVQPDGKIVVVGSNRYAVTNSNPFFTVDVPVGDFIVARYHVDGSPDRSFGGDGNVLTTFNGFGVASAVALQPDGKIVVAGSISSGQNSDWVVARYNDNGGLDPMFGGGGGAVAVSFGSKVDTAYAVALQSDGKIVVAGSADMGAGNTTNLDFAVARLNTDGTLDLSFSIDGKITTAVGAGKDEGRGITLQDGNIVVCGSAFNGANDDLALARYTATGTPDFVFGTDGKKMVDLSGTNESGHAIIPQGDKLVVGGTAGADFLLTRLNPNGSIDGAFGSGGVTIHNLGGLDAGEALAAQTDGKLVLAGSTSDGMGGGNFAIARYDANGILDPGYGNAGVAFVNDFGAAHAVALDSFGRAAMAGEGRGLFGIARVLGDPFAKITSISLVAPGTIRLEGLGTPGAAQTIRASSSLPAGFSPIGSTSLAEADGFWEFEEANLNNIPARFYRATFP